MKRRSPHYKLICIKIKQGVGVFRYLFLFSKPTVMIPNLQAKKTKCEGSLFRYLIETAHYHSGTDWNRYNMAAAS